jgi:hypothetical protein
VTDPHRPDEHTHLAFLDPTAVPDGELPAPYSDLIALR